MSHHVQLWAVDEYVVESTARSSDAPVTDYVAPEPLLANYGTGRSLSYMLDINMMCIFNSEEGTLQDYIDLR